MDVRQKENNYEFGGEKKEKKKALQLYKIQKKIYEDSQKQSETNLAWGKPIANVGGKKTIKRQTTLILAKKTNHDISPKMLAKKCY